MKNISSVLRVTAACIGIAIPTMLLAQQPVLRAVTPVDAGATHATPVVSTISAAPAASESKPLTDRWLDLQAFSHSERFRSEFNFGGAHLFDGGQERSFIQGRIKLDAGDRYSVGFRGSTGHYFNWAYSDFAGKSEAQRVNEGDLGKSFVGSPYAAERALAVAVDPAGKALLANPSTGWGLYVRELYFSASPAKALTVEFGSFGIERGVATEATTFDDDGYLDGERIIVRNPKHLFFDQVGFTTAFFGNVDTPSMFDRGAAFNQSNYRQVFVKKQFTERIAFSGEYNWLNNTDTLRQAVTVQVPETKVVDNLRFESYERLNTVNLQGLNVKGGAGYAVALQKTVFKRLSGDIGYADIDKDYSVYFGDRFFHAVGFALNGDQYGLGRHPFIHASYKVNPVITAFGFYTHAVGPEVLTLNEQGLTGGLTFDLKALANTGKRIF